MTLQRKGLTCNNKRPLQLALLLQQWHLLAGRGIHHDQLVDVGVKAAWWTRHRQTRVRVSGAVRFAAFGILGKKSSHSPCIEFFLVMTRLSLSMPAGGLPRKRSLSPLLMMSDFVVMLVLVLRHLSLSRFGKDEKGAVLRASAARKV